MTHPRSDPLVVTLVLTLSHLVSRMYHVCMHDACTDVRTQAKLHHWNHSIGWTLVATSTPERFPLWLQAFRFVHSVNFTSLLVSKLSLPDGAGIPMYVHVTLLACTNERISAYRTCVEPFLRVLVPTLV